MYTCLLYGIWNYTERLVVALNCIINLVYRYIIRLLKSIIQLKELKVDHIQKLTLFLMNCHLTLVNHLRDGS